ncbi:putative phosphodiesterase [Paraburkholderia sp. WC7.3d]
MRIQVASDLHHELATPGSAMALQIAPAPGVDVIFLAGTSTSTSRQLTCTLTILCPWSISMEVAKVTRQTYIRRCPSWGSEQRARL